MNETNDNDILRDGERLALAESASLLKNIAVDLMRFVVRSLPLTVRIVCIAVSFGGSLYAGLHYWAVFGADESAFIPALGLTLAPLAYVMQLRIRWGGLLAAGIVSVALVSILEVLPLGGTPLFTSLALAVLVITSMAQREQNLHEQSNSN